jgi:glycine cleavage system transcriptional repressor
MLRKQLVLTAIGPDKPGIVKEISSVIHEAGANLEDSRMAVLAGDFALIVLFSGELESIEKVKKQCVSLEKQLDFQISFKQPTQSTEKPESLAYRFQAIGVDQPGIVHSVSAILAEFDVNVLSLESRLTHAAFHGTAMFAFNAEIQVPTQDVMDKLTNRLDQACEELDLHYDMERLAAK